MVYKTDTQEQIVEKITEAKEILDFLILKYHSVKYNAPNTFYRPKIENCILLLRSSLNFLFSDLYEIFKSKIKKPGSINFPYSMKYFNDNKMIQLLHNDHPEIYNLMSDFVGNEEHPIYQICEYSNPLKHDIHNQRKVLLQQIYTGNYKQDEFLIPLRFTLGNNLKIIGQEYGFETGLFLYKCTNVVINNVIADSIHLIECDNINISFCTVQGISTVASNAVLKFNDLNGNETFPDQLIFKKDGCLIIRDTKYMGLGNISVLNPTVKQRQIGIYATDKISNVLLLIDTALGIIESRIKLIYKKL